ncbi:RodZ domain-containing protein [Aidingimonas lacisalsi]|uniref:RodZ domain-containing protein n=1 Tax=Aidingimonas lacisalsi TaxID=2604086 RepID=UPI0011D23860|nr:RodZ domain-containing protein [Aidingimonas lacisalsi]
MSETHYYDDPDADLAPQTSPGELLQRERDAQGLSQEEVASSLNLRPAVVRGLENDNYDEVPVATYRRGYLRAYAHLLGISEQPIIASYNARFGTLDNEQKVTPVHVTKPPSRVGAWLFKLVTVLVIVGLIGLTLLWWQSRSGNDLLGLNDSEPVAVDTMDSDSDEAVPDEASIDSENAGNEDLPPLPEEDDDMGFVDEQNGNLSDTPESVDNAAEDDGATRSGETADTNDDTDAEQVTSGSDVNLSSEDPDTMVDDDGSSQDDVDTSAVTENDAEATQESDPGRIELTFNEESWTEIFDANDERVFFGLQEAGSQATAEGEPPFRMTIGNASGVELRYSGEAIDLEERTGSNNVARFTLGE